MHPENCATCGAQQHSPHELDCGEAYPSGTPVEQLPTWGVWVERDGIGTFWGAINGAPALAYTKAMAEKALEHQAKPLGSGWAPGVTHDVRRIPHGVPRRIAPAHDIAIVGAPRRALATAPAPGATEPAPPPTMRAPTRDTDITELAAHIDEGVGKLAQALGGTPSIGSILAIAFCVREQFGAIDQIVRVRRDATPEEAAAHAPDIANTTIAGDVHVSPAETEPRSEGGSPS